MFCFVGSQHRPTSEAGKSWRESEGRGTDIINTRERGAWRDLFRRREPRPAKLLPGEKSRGARPRFSRGVGVSDGCGCSSSCLGQPQTKSERNGHVTPSGGGNWLWTSIRSWWCSWIGSPGDWKVLVVLARGRGRLPLSDGRQCRGGEMCARSPLPRTTNTTPRNCSGSRHSRCEPGRLRA